MQDIDSILASVGSLSLAELEAEHQQRDALVVRLIGEKLIIHDLMEPLRLREQDSTRGPANLAQTIETAAPNWSGLSLAHLKGLAMGLLSEITRRGGKSDGE